MEHAIEQLQILIIFLARAGMLLVHVNIIPSTDVNLITIQHILSITVSTFCYLCFGYRLSLIKEISDFSFGWIIKSTDINLNEIIDGWRSMIFCEGLMSISIAGRAHFATDLLVSLMVSSLIQPLMMNLITNGTNLNSLGRSMFEFEDNTKTSVIHVLPAGFSFIASMIFGQRVVNIKQMDLSSVPINAHSASFLGYLFVIAGFMMNNGIINNLFTVSTGMLTMLIILLPSKQDADYWSSVWILQGGLVAVISNVSCFKPFETIIVAVCTTIMYATMARLIRSSILEDYGNILTIHGIAGSLPLVLQHLCQNVNYHKALIGAIFGFTTFSIGIAVGIILLIPMKIFGILRSHSEEEVSNQNWSKIKHQTKKRGIQPGDHTITKFKRFMDTEYGQGLHEGRMTEL
ncbi:uncharacterized protein [Halyomorpha halys]|uniref:uncharacterized protein n=1 Tax=Halyomorpha halys TaxID=286706 RepID=UPI0006D4F9D4|nr:uncharacterized protein LOC106692889 [Halyomorpha halys]